MIREKERECKWWGFKKFVIINTLFWRQLINKQMAFHLYRFIIHLCFNLDPSLFSGQLYIDFYLGKGQVML